MLLSSIPAWDEDSENENKKKNTLKRATSDELANLLNNM